MNNLKTINTNCKALFNLIVKNKALRIRQYNPTFEGFGFAIHSDAISFYISVFDDCYLVHYIKDTKQAHIISKSETIKNIKDVYLFIIKNILLCADNETEATIEIKETSTGKTGVANLTGGDRVAIFYGLDDGSNDKKTSIEQFTKDFIINNIILD